MVSDCERSVSSRAPSSAEGASVEDDGAVPGKEDAALKHQPDRAGKNDPLHVAPGLRKIAGRVRVVDRGHLLHDNWPLVDLLGDKMRGGADHLYAAVESLLVGTRPRKRRKE